MRHVGSASVRSAPEGRLFLNGGAQAVRRQLGLPADGSQTSVHKLVNVYLDAEIVNEYQCKYCLVKADGATKQLSFVTTPETLVVTLNRFGGDVIDAKLHNAIAPDDTLDVRRLGGADKYWLCAVVCV